MTTLIAPAGRTEPVPVVGDFVIVQDDNRVATIAEVVSLAVDAQDDVLKIKGWDDNADLGEVKGIEVEPVEPSAVDEVVNCGACIHPGSYYDQPSYCDTEAHTPGACVKHAGWDD